VLWCYFIIICSTRIYYSTINFVRVGGPPYRQTSSIIVTFTPYKILQNHVVLGALLLGTTTRGASLSLILFRFNGLDNLFNVRFGHIDLDSTPLDDTNFHRLGSTVNNF